jgi:hypothetical protein
MEEGMPIKIPFLLLMEHRLAQVQIVTMTAHAVQRRKQEILSHLQPQQQKPVLQMLV